MLKKLFQVIKEDIVHDYKAICSICKNDGKYKIDRQLFAELKDPIGLIASQKIFIFVIILAFCCGWVLSSQYYESQCNDVIVEVIEKCEEYNNFGTNNFNQVFKDLEIGFNESEIS
jgi:hypothetical protein